MIEKVICKETQVVHEITVNKSGENSMPCPNCSPNRKKKSDKCMSYNAKKGMGTCYHDGCTFYKHEDKEAFQEYSLPEWKNYTKLTDKQVKGFEDRMIGQTTLQKMNISTKNGAVSFPYYKNGQIVNIKHRAPGKQFRTEKDCKLEWYNYDCIQDNKELIIVEGEFDALSFIQEGFENVISVPNGVNSLASVMDMELFEHIDKFYIAVDTDKAGIELRNKLLEQLGSERCVVASFLEFKDANEYLVKKGRNSLNTPLESAVYIRSKETIKLDNLLIGAKLDPNAIIEKPPVILSVVENYQDNTTKDIPIFSAGDLSMIQGKQKSKKTFLITAIVTAILNPNVHDKLKAELLEGKKGVVIFDTEQANFYGQKANQRIARIAQSLDFDYYSLRTNSPTERKKAIQRYLQLNPNCGLMIIDGIVDCLKNFNDLEESMELVQWLMVMSEKNNCHISSVLHENIGDGQKARGHLGTFLSQKCESVIRMEKKIGEDSVSTVEAKDTRGKEFRPFDLCINEKGEPFFRNITLTKNINPLSEISQPKMPNLIPIVEANEMFEENNHPF